MRLDSYLLGEVEEECDELLDSDNLSSSQIEQLGCNEYTVQESDYSEYLF